MGLSLGEGGRRREEGRAYIAIRHAARKNLVRFKAKKLVRVVVKAMVSHDANRK